MHNHSYENEFNLLVNEISFSYEKMGTKTRFEEEAKGNSEMAYCLQNLFIQKTRKFSRYLLDILGLVFYQAAVPLHSCALVLCHIRRYLTVFAPAPPVNPQTISVMLTNIKRACLVMINIKKP